jgi:hypothetical protein
VASVVAVLGGSGGVGASTFAAALAAAAGRAVLVDCDALGGGIDVVLGIESVPGARWSGLRLDGGRLDPVALDGGLPRWREVRVLAADAPPPPGSIEPVVTAAAELGPVILDVPRERGAVRAAALDCAQMCVLVAAARVPALAAARAAAPVGVPFGVVLRRVRAAAGAGAVPAAEAARLLGAPLLGTIPALDGTDVAGEPPRALVRVAAGVLDGIRVGAA